VKHQQFKCVQFNEDLNIVYHYQQEEDDGQPTWIQMALDEFRFRCKLDNLIQRKLEHYRTCKKPLHDQTCRLTSCCISQPTAGEQ